MNTTNPKWPNLIKDKVFAEKLRLRSDRCLDILDERLKRNDWDAAKWALEMMYGKPKQAVENSGSLDVAVNIIGPKKGLLSGS